MGSKIYVGGLPYSATEQELSDLFGRHGAVASARIITDKFTGQSRGFGFVEMSSDCRSAGGHHCSQRCGNGWPNLDRQ